MIIPTNIGQHANFPALWESRQLGSAAAFAVNGHAGKPDAGRRLRLRQCIGQPVERLRAEGDHSLGMLCRTHALRHAAGGRQAQAMQWSSWR